jgi:predicted DNA-binding ribbon-helix-helix protein
MKQRTTVTAEADDLAILKAEAKRRGMSLSRLLGTLVAEKAADIQSATRPRLALGRSGGANLSEQSMEDEHAPARASGGD